MVTNIITTYHMLLKKTLSDVIYPNVRVLPGLLLQVVLAVHGVVDHQTTWTKVRQVGYQIKALSGGQINWPKCARCVIYPLTNFLPVTTFWRFLTIFDNFQRDGGGLRWQNFQKIFFSPYFLPITTVISTCIFASHDYDTPLRYTTWSVRPTDW